VQQPNLGSNCCRTRDTPQSAPLLRSEQPIITMSNAAVGHVYDTIIAEVVNSVRVDFEENGVDEGALEDLKKVRLSLESPLSSPLQAALGSSAALPTHFPSSHQSDQPFFYFAIGFRMHFHHAYYFRAIVSLVCR
jgi:hypothetical protein